MTEPTDNAELARAVASYLLGHVEGTQQALQEFVDDLSTALCCGEPDDALHLPSWVELEKVVTDHVTHFSATVRQYEATVNPRASDDLDTAPPEEPDDGTEIVDAWATTERTTLS